MTLYVNESIAIFFLVALLVIIAAHRAKLPKAIGAAKNCNCQDEAHTKNRIMKLNKTSFRKGKCVCCYMCLC